MSRVTKKKILYKDLAYRLTGLCFKIHKRLGRFCRERQYANELEALLKKVGIHYQREYEIPEGPSGNRIDFLIENSIVVDIKSKKFITKEDYIQMQRYLQSSGMELGLIVNFRSTYLKPKRVLNTKLYSEHSDVHSEHSDR